MHETFLTLLQDRAHWEFELFLMLLFDGVVGCVLFPFVRKHWRHHITRDKRDSGGVVPRTAPEREKGGFVPVSYKWSIGVAPPRLAYDRWTPTQPDLVGNDWNKAIPWPRSGRFYEPVKGKPCPRCGIGVDDDGDGNCSHCVGKPVLGNCDHPRWGNVLHENVGDCINWKPVSTKTRENHG